MAMAISPVFPRFLDLSPGIRRRIYVEAGLVVNSDLDLLLNSNSKQDGRSDDRPNLLPSCALMLICRIVHTETSLLFYSTNRFVIRFKRDGDLRALRILRPKLLFTLTCFTVQLNVSDVPRGRYGHSSINCPKSENELLNGHSSSAQVLLSEWETTADYLARHIKPNALDFGLVCDIADMEIAQRAVAPLSRFPILAACHIRLSPSPNVGLQQIARDAGLRAEGKTTFFDFIRLPPELRLRILEYTDLVAPLNRVSWFFGQGHSRGYGLPYMSPCPSNAPSCKPPYDICHPNTHQTCQKYGPDNKFECWTCSHYACQFWDCWEVKKRGNHQSRFCFCQCHHAAYTPLCHCWAPPIPMFLVSRAFRHDAHKVFFGQNHFDVNISVKIAHYFIRRALRPARYPESVFLNHVVPTSALQYLRSLEFRFLNFNHCPAASQSQKAAGGYEIEHRDWQSTVDRVIRNDGLTPTLSSLLIHISANNVEGLDTWYWSRPKMLLEKSDSIIDTLKAVVASFWPPLLQGPHKRQPQLLFAFVESNYMRAGYFIRPGRQQQWELSRHEPPDFATERDLADLTVERAVVGFGGSTSNETLPGVLLDATSRVESGGEWVEGIWATYFCHI